ncbi:hypothetical protein GCM10007897_42580 [Sphingobium jiangsuense]|uniref:Uncharacterized protein n=1 Tax=Sphingobium jiangsuense TaxID=870476 RepID=A0A7W6BKU8_9SPHN|nr:hypothetical protein [Sphingobium jiangsuense]MBB3928921.1 hypothetical protein [Sphingobium jiangsuense]GLT02834.1 hypothetical protein GCM10007897_42580 [Sphingobium jiangsuense]
MDFGFGGLVEKFEEHLGEIPTRIILIAIGGATIVACVNIMLTQAVIPLYNWAITLFADASSGALKSVLNSLGSFIGGTMGIVGAFYVMRPWIRRRYAELEGGAQQHLAEMREAHERIIKQIDAAKAEFIKEASENEDG